MNETNPKIFISYSWSSPNHEDWVINLAERLVSDGIEVKIDKWDLKEGHDMFDFMESMVNSSDIDKVLIILDEKYSSKANSRKGGVGTETQIISPEIYNNVSQEKFIPIVTQRNESNEAFIPTFLKSRIYIDFSEEEHFEKSYESLLRNLYKRPVYNKPKLGKAPSFLFEETPMNHKTSVLLRGFDKKLAQSPNSLNSLARDFFDKFYDNLKDYSITFTSRDYKIIGKEIIDNLNLFSPLRDEYISFLEKLTVPELDFDVDILIEFLEKLPRYKQPLDDRGSWSDVDFANFKFIIHELFLYLILVCLKNRNYKLIEEIFYSNYFIHDRYNYSKEPSEFAEFYNYIDAIDHYYKETYSKQFHSPMADLMIKRIPENYSKESFVQADLLCHYIADMNNKRWFPITYIYYTRGRMDLFERLASKRYFEKIKVVFGVNTVDEFREKLTKLEEKGNNNNSMRYNGSFDSVAPLYRIIDKDKIGTLR